jgi:hypothetical protein
LQKSCFYLPVCLLGAELPNIEWVKSTGSWKWNKTNFVISNFLNNYLSKFILVFLWCWQIWSKVHFFSSVAHIWVPGAKTTGPIVKKFGFS